MDDPNLLVDFAGSDDAGIYRLNEEMALVTTVDIITPPVDDPFLFGQIAAANAISDVYAMGARPLVCLNLVCFPSKILAADILHQIVAGALDKITESGAVLAGGHSVDDDEPKFGLSVTGIVHPDTFWSNSGARPGDVLILTKPLGSGVLLNANLKKWVSSRAMDQCIESLTTLNKSAFEIMADFDIHAATDISGFGLAGHCYEMAKGAGVMLKIDMGRIPVMSEALDMYERGMNTGVNQFNRERVEKNMLFEKEIPGWHQEIVFDPQTSGGMLAAVPEDQGKTLREALQRKGLDQAEIIGRVETLKNKILLLFH